MFVFPRAQIAKPAEDFVKGVVPPSSPPGVVTLPLHQVILGRGRSELGGGRLRPLGSVLGKATSENLLKQNTG